MSRLGRILVIGILAMIAIAIFVQMSSLPKILTEYRNYGFVLGVWYVALFALFVWFIALLGSPRLKVTFGGGVGRPGRKQVGDHPIHQGGAIFGLVATISNTGGKKLTLETRMFLRDRKTGQNLYQVPLMPRVPKPEKRIEQSETSEFVGTPQYCPEFLVLELWETKRYRLYFFVEEWIVDKIGVDEHNTIRVWNARQDLIFIDRGLGIVFTCIDKGQDNEYECKRSRLY